MSNQVFFKQRAKYPAKLPPIMVPESMREAVVSMAQDNDVSQSEIMRTALEFFFTSIDSQISNMLKSDTPANPYDKWAERVSVSRRRKAVGGQAITGDGKL